MILGPHKGLETTDIDDLGPLTVVCGPNDSGKTTVLEALCSDKTRRFGCDAGALFGKLSEGMMSVVTKPTGAPARARRSMVKNWLPILHDVQERRPRWYAGDAPKILHDLVAALERTQTTPEDANKALAVIKGVLPENVLSVLIPAKRRLDVSGEMARNANVEPSGAGVLQELSWLKNQRQDSNAHARFQSLKESFREVTQGYDFDVVAGERLRVELCFSRDGARWFPGADCGLGLQDVLLILYFWTAPESGVLAIEEPESHLHPEVQRRLLSHFERASVKQVFLSTHSNVFLSGGMQRVMVTRYVHKVLLTDVSCRAQALSDLGYSVADNLLADVVVLVVPSDVPVIEEFCSKLPSMSGVALRAWPMGGDIMDQLDLSVFTDTYRTFALVDGDPKSGRVRRKFVERCEQHGVTVTRLARYAIENYFSLSALRQVYGAQVPEGLTQLDPNQSVEDQIGFSPKRRNRALARQMSFDEIRNTDLGEFFLRLKAAGENLRQTPMS